MGLEKNNNIKSERPMAGYIQNAGLAVMLVAVIGLTAAVIALLTMNAAFEEEVPFRMEQLTAPDGVTDADIDSHFLPAFIGISVKGEQRGVSAGYNVVRDVYHMLTPVLEDVLGGAAREVTAETFETAVEESPFVYLRYHTVIPVQVIHACSGGVGNDYESSVGVYDLLIQPDRGFRVLVRGMNGAVYAFDGTYESYFTVETLSELLVSYQRNFVDFVFTEGVGEPQFTERLQTKNMLVTEKTAALMQEKAGHIESVLRLMNFNPDKLYTHDESDMGYVYVENHGVLRLLNDSMEYTAANSEGGISVGMLLGQYGVADYTLSDYIGTACLIVDRVKGLSDHYAGGDGEILLTSAVTDEDGVLTLRFMYTFDNLRLAGCEPALVVGFRNGRLISLRLYTVSMRNLGTKEESLLEEWYYAIALARCPGVAEITDIRQVYQTDFYAESISASWSVIYGLAKELRQGR